MSISPEEALAVYRRADRLYDLDQIEQSLDRMSGDIRARLERRNPLALCVMNGGLVPFGRLVSRLDFPMQLDYIHATRYRGHTQGGDLRWVKRQDEPMQGRSVLIVDDILDEGYTLRALITECREQGAREVYTAVLAVKLHDRGCGLTADFFGLEVEDRYVFGYGMDYKGYLRNAPGIFAVGA